MAIMRLRYVHSFIDKTGRVRFYFRYRGNRWPLPGEPGSSEFSSRYDELRFQHVTAETRFSKVRIWSLHAWSCDREIPCQRKLHK